MSAHFSIGRFKPEAASVYDLAAIGVKMHFAAGEEIYAQGEGADLVYLILKGAARTSRLQADGRRQIGDFYYAGELAGLETTGEHRFTAEALSACTALVIRKSALAHHGEEGARVERMIWEAAMEELRRTQDHLFLLGRKTACEKVAGFLMNAAARGKTETATLAMSRQDMADYLGLTIETVSRMLTQLQADRLLRFINNRSYRIVDWDRLNGLISI